MSFPVAIAFAALLGAGSPASPNATGTGAPDGGRADAGTAKADGGSSDADAAIVEHLDVLEKLDLLDNLELFQDAAQP